MRDAVARDLIGDGRRAFVAVDSNRKPARERPEQFEHRNVERHAGDGQPHARRASDGAIHAGEEIHHIAVLYHHAFRLARGARGVNHVCNVLRRRRGDDGFRALAPQVRVFSVENGEPRRSRRKMRARRSGGEQHRHLGVFNHQRKAILRIGGIERNIRAACFQNSEQADDKSFRTAHGNAHQLIGPDAELLQTARQAIGAFIQVAIGERAALRNHRGGIGRTRGLRGEKIRNGAGARIIGLGAIPLKQLRG